MELALSEGDTITGYKMGLTSKAKQRDVQVFDTIRGTLLASFAIENGGTASTKSRIHPRVEPEIAVVLKRDIVEKNIDRATLIAAIEGIYPALEIVDSRYENFKFKLSDVIADNTSASGYMVGKTNYLSRLEELNLLGVIVKKNGQIVETGCPAAVLGDPLLSVLSLLGHTPLRKGMVILTGGITNSVSFREGETLAVYWPGELLEFKAV